MNIYPPIPREHLKWIGVDFDGTIAESSWSIEDPNALPGEPLPRVREKLQGIYDEGFKAIVYTARSWSDYELIEAYMLEHELPFSGIVCGKLLVRLMVDDRALHAEEPYWTSQ